jgi:hypothetical protein
MQPACSYGNYSKKVRGEQENVAMRNADYIAVLEQQG